MKTLIPIIVLVVFALACGGLQGTGTSKTTDNNTADEKPVIRKVVDIPSLFGKTKDDVIKGVTEGKKKNDFSDWMDFEFPQGTLTVNFTKGKADTFKFALPIYGGDFLVDTPENLGILTGIDLAGKTPDVKLDGFVTYKKQQIAGTSLDVTLDRKIGGDRFYDLVVRAAY